jgi:hypothetical protein
MQDVKPIQQIKRRISCKSEEESESEQQIDLESEGSRKMDLDSFSKEELEPEEEISGSKDRILLAPDCSPDETSGNIRERCLGNRDVRHNSKVEGKSKQVPVSDGPVAANQYRAIPLESKESFPGAISIQKQDQQIQTEQQETSAAESHRSEPLWTGVLVKKFNDLQRELQIANREIKEITRSRKWAKKAHARRERRRAAKQKEAGNHPKFPVDCPQTPPIVGDYGNKDEAGIQPPTEDWTLWRVRL